MKTLTKDDILNANDAQIEKVIIPEWGGDVHVKMMTAGERDVFEFYAEENKVSRNIRAALLAFTICDKNGNTLFEPKDAPALGKRSSVAVNRAFKISSRLNALFQADIEELEKN